MQVHNVYEKGDRAFNEDTCVMNENIYIYAAIDGATGLSGAPGYIASQAIRDGLNQGKSDSSLQTLVEAANATIKKRTVEYYEAETQEASIEGFAQLSKVQRSSAAMVAIKFNEELTQLEYVHAGDCMLFLQYNTGEVKMVTNDSVENLDKVALEELIRLQSKWPEAEIDQLRKWVDPILQKNRQQANVPGGYSVLDGSQEGLENLVYGDIDLDGVTNILLVSDGLELPQPLEVSDSWMATAQLAFSNGIAGLYEEVTRREEADPNCTTYPRLKKADDKTGILISLD